jgi:hypothetical protein
MNLKIIMAVLFLMNIVNVVHIRANAKKMKFLAAIIVLQYCKDYNNKFVGDSIDD